METAKVLSEEGKDVKVGSKTFKVKPITMLTMAKIGDCMEGFNIADAEGTKLSFVVSDGVTKRANEIAKAVLLDTKWKRMLYSGYIDRHLDSESWKAVYDYIVSEFDYDFFLQSLISLSGMTAPKKASTNEAHPHGQ